MIRLTVSSEQGTYSAVYETQAEVNRMINWFSETFNDERIALVDRLIIRVVEEN